MVGNHIWEPGQFTDDTEMGVIVAESLLARNGIDAYDQLTRFRAWGHDAKDVGNLTREVLGSPLPAADAAREVMRLRGGRSTQCAEEGARRVAVHGRALTALAG